MTTTTLLLIGVCVLALAVLWVSLLYASARADLAEERARDRDRWRDMHRNLRRGR